MTEELLNSILTKYYNDFHIARGYLTLNGFQRQRILPILIKHINKHHPDMKAEDLTEALENGTGCIYDDEFNKSKYFDLPTMQRWISAFYKGRSIKKPQIYYPLPTHELTEKEYLAIKQGYERISKEPKRTLGDQAKVAIHGTKATSATTGALVKTVIKELKKDI